MKAKTLSVLAAVMALAIFSYAAFAADPMGPGQANPGTPEKNMTVTATLYTKAVPVPMATSVSMLAEWLLKTARMPRV